MTEIVRGHWFALRRPLEALRSLVRIGPGSAILGIHSASCSPRILQVVRRIRRSGIRGGRNLLSNSNQGHACRYLIRPQLIPIRTGSSVGFSIASPATRFTVVDADEALLQFLDMPATGFHVFELCCAGFERLWRDDLSKVMEIRKPVLARMTIYVGSEAIELEHLACPLLESGRIVEIHGWFDEAQAKTIPTLDWAAVRHVRRTMRSHPLVTSYR